ncbi:peptidyl-prolyl cis-trans isomerase [Sungkyunkwania multivorans]|uniref:Peptidyl-prolyl cis-trans isomerase n=1 Tax=Sungkyunkwania multivorans TaxID=1173618 RepID=A0ABW3CTW2_9FLAO
MARIVKYSIFFLFLVMASCEWFQPKPTGEVIARAGNEFLYKNDIEGVVPEGIAATDSTIMVKNFIDNWARQQLLIEKAKLNLSEGKQESLSKLVQQYENDLFTKTYQEALVSAGIDTIVSDTEIATFYEDNKENFKLNEQLLKLRYIKLSKRHNGISEVTTRLKRFDEEDKRYLDSIALQFRAYSLNDSVWAKAVQVYQRIPPLTDAPADQYLKKSQFFTLEDSLEVYLVRVNDVLQRNDTAPLAYVAPTVKQIIINRRKLEFIKKLEKDIIDDAIKNKQYEIYE